MPDLPQRHRIALVAGSQWAQTFQFFNDDGTRMNIAGKTFAFTVRVSASDASPVPLVGVTATATAQGYVSIDVDASTVQVVLSPSATLALGTGCWAFALWTDPDLPDETCFLEGPLFSRRVAAA
ncbi:hypothetical protein [Streptomyces goshikiensis]|uniref:hypothetical protein n=1 Tax=Streptomyces goshikiensis TaxID=1942 RepID=UPI003676D42B